MVVDGQGDTDRKKLEASGTTRSGAAPRFCGLHWASRSPDSDFRTRPTFESFSEAALVSTNTQELHSVVGDVTCILIDYERSLTSEQIIRAYRSMNKRCPNYWKFGCRSFEELLDHIADDINITKIQKSSGKFLFVSTLRAADEPVGWSDRQSFRSTLSVPASFKDKDHTYDSKAKDDQKKNAARMRARTFFSHWDRLNWKWRGAVKDCIREFCKGLGPGMCAVEKAIVESEKQFKANQDTISYEEAMMLKDYVVVLELLLQHYYAELNSNN